MIIQYIRNKQREKVGVIVAIPTFGQANSFSIGWSKCNMKLDQFDWRQGQRKHRWGVELALTRAQDATSLVKDKNKCLSEELEFFEELNHYDDNWIPVIPQSCEAVCQRVINRACRAYGNHCQQISNAALLGYDKLQILTDCGVKECDY